MVKAETKSCWTGPPGLTIRSGTTRSRGTRREADQGWPTLWMASIELDSSLRGRASGPRTPFSRSGRKAF